MTNIDFFFTPNRYDETLRKNFKQSVQEGIEDYFYLGGKRAYVILGKVKDGSQEVEIKHLDQNKIKQLMLDVIKIISYTSMIIPLIMLAAKAVFRKTHKFHLSRQNQTDAQTFPSDLTPALLLKIQNNFNFIINKQWFPGVSYYASQPNHVVFSLNEDPRIIFKMRKTEQKTASQDYSMDERLVKIKKTRGVAETHRLNMLVIPKVERFELHDSQNKPRVLLAVEKLDLADNSEAHAELPLAQKAKLINQLAIMIIHTGLSDVANRNIPIVPPLNSASREFRIGLIDLEEMTSSYTGLFGGCKRIGLSGVFESEELVLEAVKKQTAPPESEPIYKKVAALEFEKYPKSNEKLKEIAKNLCREVILMRQLDAMSDQEPSDFFVNVNHGKFEKADELHSDGPLSPNAYATDEEYYEAQKIGIVLKELKKLKIISEVTRRNGHGLWLKIDTELVV